MLLYYTEERKGPPLFLATGLGKVKDRE